MFWQTERRKTSKRRRKNRNKTRKRKVEEKEKVVDKKDDKTDEWKFISENFLKKSGIAGYGVFAGKDYNIDEEVEKCPFIEVKREHLMQEKNPLRSYVFTSHLNDDSEIVVFGNGSIFNHSDDPNVYYYHNCSGNRLLYFAAKKPIKEGDELFITYGQSHPVCLYPKDQKNNQGSNL
jgi:SET domain-containing protein